VKRAAIYCRVSTIHHGQSVDMQLHDLRKLAEQRGFQIVKEYSDQGISGSKNSRPALDAMLADARRGKFQILLTWRLDRLGRSTAHLIHLLEDLKMSRANFLLRGAGLQHRQWKIVLHPDIGVCGV
jgi:DNA invertase Pin-like site-specific DNA recombinase